MKRRGHCNLELNDCVAIQSGGKSFQQKNTAKLKSLVKELHRTKEQEAVCTAGLRRGLQGAG